MTFESIDVHDFNNTVNKKIRPLERPHSLVFHGMLSPPWDMMHILLVTCKEHSQASIVDLPYLFSILRCRILHSLSSNLCDFFVVRRGLYSDSAIAPVLSKIDQLLDFFFLRYPVLSIATKSQIAWIAR